MSEDIVHPWVCFHCGFETYSQEEAEAHFGDDSGDPVICVYWARQTPEDRLKDFQDLTRELNAERDESYKLRQEVEKLEYQLGLQEADLKSRFKGCTSITEVWQMFDSMEGRMLAAEQRVRYVPYAQLEQIDQQIEKGYKVTANA